MLGKKARAVWFDDEGEVEEEDREYKRARIRAPHEFAGAKRPRDYFHGLDADYEAIRLPGAEYGGYEPPWKIMDDEPEIKFKDVEHGDYGLGAGGDILIRNVGRLVERRVLSCIQLAPGVDDNNRVGNIVTGVRFSCRGTFFFDYLNQKVNFGSSMNWAMLRVFVFVDKQQRTSPATIRYPLGGQTGGNVYTFVPGQGFLATDRIHSFYDLDNIGKYRILYDSGVVNILPEKHSCNYQLSLPGTDVVFPNAAPRVLEQGYYKGGDQMEWRSILYSGGAAGESADELNADLAVYGSIDGAVELAAGTGGPIELVAAFPELTSGISASGVRMKSRFNDLNPVIPSWNTYSLPNNINRRETYYPSPEPQYFDININLNGMQVYFNQNGPEAEWVLPVKNDVRVGILYYSDAYDCRYSLSTRFTFTDD